MAGAHLCDGVRTGGAAAARVWGHHEAGGLPGQHLCVQRPGRFTAAGAASGDRCISGGAVRAAAHHLVAAGRLLGVVAQIRHPRHPAHATRARNCHHNKQAARWQGSRVEKRGAWMCVARPYERDLRSSTPTSYHATLPSFLLSGGAARLCTDDEASVLQQA